MRCRSANNHSLDYVSRRLEDMDVECVIIGDGDEIVAQYPQAQETITPMSASSCSAMRRR